MSQDHVWLGFEEPIITPACSETAAIFLFAPSDPMLFGAFVSSIRGSATALKNLDRTIYQPGKNTLNFNLVTPTGTIAWSIRLHLGSDRIASWSAPAWWSCSDPACHLHDARQPLLCSCCEATRTFVWTWLLAANQSLLGLYREQSVEDTNETQRQQRGMSETDTGVQSLQLTPSYRVVRAIDIVNPKVPSVAEPQSRRQSWVELLNAIDPKLVVCDQREVPLRTRILRHPRYHRYIADHGTNQVEVRPHTRKILMRADPKGITKVTAKKRKHSKREA